MARFPSVVIVVDYIIQQPQPRVARSIDIGIASPSPLELSLVKRSARLILHGDRVGTWSDVFAVAHNQMNDDDDGVTSEKRLFPRSLGVEIHAPVMDTASRSRAAAAVGVDVFHANKAVVFL